LIRIRSSVDIKAPRRQVWTEISDLASHSTWMADAADIEFLTPVRRGIGTRMRVSTRIGPLRTEDIIEVVRWEEGSAIGIRHSGAVGGAGELRVSPVAGATRVIWSEELSFPGSLGGLVGEAVAATVLRRVWRRNLLRLKLAMEG
jgi:carbon monoxide dehydrogenase subunit G